MPASIRSIQPGGGTFQSLELAWGRLRRWFLRTVRPGYAKRMRSRLQGDASNCPVDAIDSRDLKFYRNVSDCWFEPHDDPFAWRGRLPFARAGFCELLVFGGGMAALAVILALAGWWWAAVAPALLACFTFYFFRDPHRTIPDSPGAVVSPADGKIVEIAELADHEFIGAPAVRIGIFLSVFNVHVNRCSLAGRLIRLQYVPGKFLNALLARSAEENERMELWLVEPEPPRRRFVIRQIAGAIARRIVCEPRPGEILRTGQRFGMIKFGSRTELLLPRDGLTLTVRVGDRVRGGASLMGRYT